MMSRLLLLIITLVFFLCLLSPNAATASSNVTFSLIHSQVVGIPFLVTLTTDDLKFDRSVKLSSTSGHVSPKVVHLAHGRASVYVTVFSVGKNDRLYALWSDSKNRGKNNAVSNPFDVTDSDGTIPQDASLTGTVLSSINRVPIAGASIELYSHDPRIGTAELPIASTITEKDGTYRFQNSFPGTFFLKITAASHRDSINPITLVSHLSMTGQTKLFSSEEVPFRIPVLLVPGIMGSTIPKLDRIIPRLPFLTPLWNSKTLELVDPFDTVGWTLLEDAFQEGGYTKGVNLFEVPYDWTLSVSDIRDNYLIPWINEAKRITGSNQVDIIALSMGVLVARAYLQSENYANDVRKYAMVGPPNNGVSYVYYLWEGGDPIETDLHGGKTRSHMGIFSYFITYALDYLFEDRKLSLGTLCQWDFLHINPVSCDTSAIYNIIHQYFFSPGQLMPTYDDALQIQTNPSINQPIIFEENSLIKALNGIPCINPSGCLDPQAEIYSFAPYENVLTPDASGVQTQLFVGQNEETLGTIFVQQNSSESTYPDGQPIDSADSLLGDGTVLAATASLGNLPIVTAEQNHDFLIRTFTGQIYQFITGSTLSRLPQQLPQSPRIVIEIKGHVQMASPEITDMKGKSIELPSKNVKKDFSLLDAVLSISNPANGTYTTLLKPSKNATSYRISISYIDPVRNFIQSSSDIIGHYDSTSTQFNFNFDNAQSQSPITLSRNFLTPTHVVGTNFNGLIQLDWDDETGQSKKDVKNYEIYWKTENEPGFSYLGKTKELERHYVTPHKVTTPISNSYIVRAILNDGTSTFFSQVSTENH